MAIIGSNQISANPSQRCFEGLFKPSLLLALVATFIAPAVTGCGGGEKRVQTFKSSGKVVKSDGSPVPHALVVLHPQSGLDTVPKPRGTTDEAGNFSLSTYETADGAPSGEFAVTIEQWIRDDPNNPPKNHLPPGLSKVESSGLKVSIAAGENQLQPFEIR